MQLRERFHRIAERVGDFRDQHFWQSLTVPAPPSEGGGIRQSFSITGSISTDRWTIERMHYNIIQNPPFAVSMDSPSAVVSPGLIPVADETLKTADGNDHFTTAQMMEFVKDVSRQLAGWNQAEALETLGRFSKRNKARLEHCGLGAAAA